MQVVGERQNVAEVKHLKNVQSPAERYLPASVGYDTARMNRPSGIVSLGKCDSSTQSRFHKSIEVIKLQLCLPIICGHNQMDRDFIFRSVHLYDGFQQFHVVPNLMECSNIPIRQRYLRCPS